MQLIPTRNDLNIEQRCFHPPLERFLVQDGKKKKKKDKTFYFTKPGKQKMLWVW